MRCPNCDGPIEGIDISDLSMQHKLALSLFVQKYKDGARQHGDLQTGKQWTRDRLMEEVDKAFYTIFDLLEHL